ncbi:FAD-binding oxidoreductase [Planktothrix sp. FACHB-1355]|uniref:FAD-binding oxidoreductase n=1 Tax=Aerosakkonema funiforme FACHB-1375 TaxID=2949571 RepID=A0A926VEY5_9CYAN|nr:MULTISPECIES: FAD-dependent oxidoreductase [Oscillatoriales]MBD2182569.1 FAD-binding oxidoreductase [Aerosakkonema funiforme FACHB-1375]MBD3561501.1 FAD-binding oxidoreductase [Planktothrix sp. FACHB-1355]
MSHVAIIGCGVVGAAIAYELSQVPGLNITVLDKQSPPSFSAIRGEVREINHSYQGSTSAALGVLMGAISQKVKGKAWQMRQTSIQRYETLIPELEAAIGRKIPFNRQGILMLCLEGENLPSWEELVKVRADQGWHLEIWDTAQLQVKCPQLSLAKISAAVYSPQDRQVDPTALTVALVEAADRNGVSFQFGVSVLGMETTVSDGENFSACKQIDTTNGTIEVDWLVIAAGLGSTPLTASLAQSIEIGPVLGQALHLRLEHPLGNPDFQPVITGNDVHIVPVGGGDYWVGATVEFPVDGYEVVADASQLDAVMDGAIAFCPELAQATIMKTWSGLRPRPSGRPAPIIGNLPGFSNILLATGHYRNGVLLAPATAQAIREAILGKNTVF